MQRFVKKANLLRCWESQSPPQYFVDFLVQLQADRKADKAERAQDKTDRKADKAEMTAEFKSDMSEIKTNMSADRKFLENLSKSFRFYRKKVFATELLHGRGIHGLSP